MWETLFIVVMLLIGIYGWISVTYEIVKKRMECGTVPRCPRCDEMRDFGHKCSDSVVV